MQTKTFAEELAEKTLQYWSVSRVFYTGVGEPLNMGDAIEQCNKQQEVLGPSRPLSRRVAMLQERLIQGRGRRRKTSKAPNVVVKLERQQRKAESALAEAAAQ